MERIFISDTTLKQTGKQLPLSFREKIELGRMIDRLGVDALELPAIMNPKVDTLLIKSVSASVRTAEIAVPVSLSADSVSTTWNALKETHCPRLQVCAPVSSVRMEYLFHLKPAGLSEIVEKVILECKKHTDNIEFIAEDALRSDRTFLHSLIKKVIDCGVRRISFQEAAGVSLPEELRKDIVQIISAIPEHENIVFGIDCCNDLSLADACAVESIYGGIREIKSAAYSLNSASLENIVKILALKGDRMGVFCHVHKEEIRRGISQVRALCNAGAIADKSLFHKESEHFEDIKLTHHDSRESIEHARSQWGYLLSEEDREKVYQAFLNVSEKKESISLKELDALIATEAMQVPPAYKIARFVVNSGNEIGAMVHMRLLFHEKPLEGISTGDGVIDAAFLALEKAVGRHFELDDFQIQAVTEGKEAMGETIVKLRSQGKLYSGRGLSTDIVGSSIMAYINALNKIVYEEEEE